MPKSMQATGTFIDQKTGKRVVIGPRPVHNLLKKPLFSLLVLSSFWGTASADEARAMKVRAEQMGAWGIDSIAPTATTSTGPIFVEITGQNLGAFGDLVTVEKTPVIQMDFVYGAHPQLSTSAVTNSASVTTSGGLLILQSSTTTNGTATFLSKNPARYRAGQGITARFTTVFSTGIAQSTQTVGMGDNGDGYFFGYNGTTFGILHKNRGTESWVAQSSWNGDKADGTGFSGFNWDKTKGNVMQITYPYLGFGNIKFFVQDNITSRFILVHTIRYNNSNTIPQLSNPSLKFKAYVANNGSTTNTRMAVASVGVFLNGQRVYIGPQFGVSNIKTAVTTEQSIFALRNAMTYNGVVNTGVLRLRSISFANDNGTAIGKMRIIKGATIGGSPTFTPLSGATADNGMTITNGTSIASFDVAGSTGTLGYTVFNSLSSRNTSFEMDITAYNIHVFPGEDVIFAAECAAPTSFGIAVNWNEDN